jgi:hypothetical protein
VEEVWGEGSVLARVLTLKAAAMKRRAMIRPHITRDPQPNQWFWESSLLLFDGQTLGHDGGVHAFAQLGRDLVDLVPFVDFDGLVGGVENDAAVLAACSVFFDLCDEPGAELFVEVVG